MFFIFNVAHGYYDCLFSQPPVNHWISYQFVTVHLKITVLQCNVKAQKNWNKLVCSVFTLLYMFYLPLHKLCKKTCIQHSNNCVILRTCTRCTHGYRLTRIETRKTCFEHCSRKCTCSLQWYTNLGDELVFCIILLVIVHLQGYLQTCYMKYFSLQLVYTHLQVNLQVVCHCKWHFLEQWNWLWFTYYESSAILDYTDWLPSRMGVCLCRPKWLKICS